MIGVTAVIALISTISGVSSSFSSMGAGTLSISITGSDLKGGLSADDISQLSALDEVQGITPSVSLSGRVTRGRRLNVVDEDNMSCVCLIDRDMVEAFFYGADPVGEYLYINGVPFLVAGLFEDGEAAADSPGALPWQIQAQFLIESFLLSLPGGVAGAVPGLMLSWALCAYMAAAFAISPGAIALGVGFSAAVGIVFGWAPARRASALDPIDALRSM